MQIEPKERYEQLERVGEGTYGVVFKAKDTISQQIVAKKKIKLENQDEGVPSTAMRQISILKQLTPHPNVVKTVQYEPAKKHLSLIFDYVDYDMKKYMSERKFSITPYEIKLLIYQVINGVDYCHSRRIIHRDLKPQNLLIDRQGHLKIADFGLARAFGIPIKTLTHQIQTLWYRAPEVLLGQKRYSLGVDIWAVGCIFAELLEKKPLFVGDSQIDQIFKIFQFQGTPSPSEWANTKNLPELKATFPKFKPADPNSYFKTTDNLAIDLLLKMIQLDPTKRISMRQALKHSYFQDIKQSDRLRFQIRK